MPCAIFSAMYNEQYLKREGFFKDDLLRTDAVVLVVADLVTGKMHTVARETRKIIDLEEINTMANLQLDTFGKCIGGLVYYGIMAPGGHVDINAASERMVQIIVPKTVIDEYGTHHTVIPFVTLAHDADTSGAHWTDNPPECGLVYVYQLKMQPSGPSAAQPNLTPLPKNGLAGLAAPGAPPPPVLPVTARRQGAYSVTGQRAAGGQGRQITRARRYKTSQKDAAGATDPTVEGCATLLLTHLCTLPWQAAMRHRPLRPLRRPR